MLFDNSSVHKLAHAYSFEVIRFTANSLQSISLDIICFRGSGGQVSIHPNIIRIIRKCQHSIFLRGTPPRGSLITGSELRVVAAIAVLMCYDSYAVFITTSYPEPDVMQTQPPSWYLG